MLSTTYTPSYTYRAHGLTIGSCLELPELLPSEGRPDVLILTQSIPSSLRTANAQDPAGNNPIVQTDSTQCLLKLSKQLGANFLIRNGSEILVDVDAVENIDGIRLAILGYCLTALLFQRGFMVLHANALKTKRGAIAICGARRAGKSTLTTALYKRGYRVIADDLTAVDVRKDICTVVPGIPRLKLWKDTLAFFDESVETLRPIQADLNKYSFPLNGAFHNRKEPLHGIYILKPSDKTASAQLHHLEGIEKFRALNDQLRTYLPEQLPHGSAWLMRTNSTLAQSVDVAVVERPSRGNSVNEVADIVEEDLFA